MQDRPEERCPRTSASPVFLGLWAGRLSGSFQREPRWPLPSSPRDSLVGAPCPQAASSERSPQGCQGQSLGRSLAWRPAALCPGSVLAWVSASPSVLQPQAQKYGGGSLKRARDREFDFHSRVGLGEAKDQTSLCDQSVQSCFSCARASSVLALGSEVGRASWDTDPRLELGPGWGVPGPGKPWTRLRNDSGAANAWQRLLQPWHC